MPPPLLSENRRMTSWTALAKLAAGPSGPEARRHPRFRANTMVCDRGRVLDFSATGLRIDFPKGTRYEVGQTAELCLQHPKGEHHCQAEVVWIKKTGRRSAEVGFRFADEESRKRATLFRSAYDPLADGEWSNR